MRKKRGYNRDTPTELLRDYKLFAIACEGYKRESEYFKLFQYITQRVKVDIIEQNHYSNETNHKSSPKWVIDSVAKYVNKYKLDSEDEIWIVIDKDRWSEKDLRHINKLCIDLKWNFVISNPCFEIWLFYHIHASPEICKSNNCNELKHELSKMIKGGYHHNKIFPFIKNAILNSKNSDTDPNHFLPNFKQTKVYQLGESLFSSISANDWEFFINKTLPLIIKKKSNI